MDGTDPLSVFCEAARRKHFDYLAQLVYSLAAYILISVTTASHRFTHRSKCPKILRIVSDNFEEVLRIVSVILSTGLGL